MGEERGPLKEVEHQVTYGNGRTTEETKGLTLRELVLEVRDELKLLRSELAKHEREPHNGVSPGQFALFVGAYSTLLVSLHALFFR